MNLDQLFEKPHYEPLCEFWWVWVFNIAGICFLGFLLKEYCRLACTHRAIVAHSQGFIPKVFAIFLVAVFPLVFPPHYVTRLKVKVCHFQLFFSIFDHPLTSFCNSARCCSTFCNSEEYLSFSSSVSGWPSSMKLSVQVGLLISHLWWSRVRMSPGYWMFLLRTCYDLF